MTVAFGMVALGGLVIYCGWKNLSVWAAIRGDNTVVKPTVTGGSPGTARQTIVTSPAQTPTGVAGG